MTIQLPETCKRSSTMPDKKKPEPYHHSELWVCPCGAEGVMETHTHFICEICARVWPKPLQTPMPPDTKTAWRV